MFESAIRELEEETGISRNDVEVLQEIPIDVDTHQIPENSKKNEGAHLHHDIRYLFRAKETLDVTIQEDEVEHFGWESLEVLSPRIQYRIHSALQATQQYKLAHRVAAIIKQDGKILVVKAQKNGDIYYVLPGGGLESDESIQECAIRELKEETNLDITVDNIAAIKDNFMKHTHGIEIYVNATITGGEEQLGYIDEKEAENMLALEWKTPEELAQLRFYPKEFRGSNFDFCGKNLGRATYKKHS